MPGDPHLADTETGPLDGDATLVTCLPLDPLLFRVRWLGLVPARDVASELEDLVGGKRRLTAPLVDREQRDGDLVGAETAATQCPGDREQRLMPTGVVLPNLFSDRTGEQLPLTAGEEVEHRFRDWDELGILWRNERSVLAALG